MKRLIAAMKANRDGIVLVATFVAALLATQLNDDHVLVHRPQLAEVRP